MYLHLPLRNRSELEHLVAQQSDKHSPMYHHWLTLAQFRATYGPAPSDLRKAATTLAALGFRTTVTSQGVIADGPQSAVEKTFNIHLSPHVAMSSKRGVPATPQLVADRAPQLPAALKSINAQVGAFSPLPPLSPDSMLASAGPVPNNRYSPDGPYWMTDLKQAYVYPSYKTAIGAGSTIAIVAASDFNDSDVALYFGHENLTPPSISRRAVDGGGPPFNLGNGNSIEVSLDVQQAGGSAPGAHVIVYEGPNSSIGVFFDIYVAMVEDNNADVVSTSFGLCELIFTAAYQSGQDFTFIEDLFHDVYLQGNSQGITFVNSSGDNGALGCPDPGFSTAVYGVQWPANDPSVTGVGGTNLVTKTAGNSRNSRYTSENAFDDAFSASSRELPGSVWGSGGGISTFWAQPAYQTLVNTGSNMRTVPDIAMHMGGCPVGAVTPCGADRSADIAALGGNFYLLIGTSASAPEFAGLQAIQDQILGSRVGNANFGIYELAVLGTVGNGPVYHSNIPGNNGYASKPGYDYITGVGTPYAAQYALDPFGPFANDPQTPTNP
jgi:subtilase family serine protease